MASIRRQGVLLVAAVLVACGGTAARTAATPSPSPAPSASLQPSPPAGLAAERVWLLRNNARGSIDITDVASLHTVASLPSGIVAPDWTRVYTVSVDTGFGTALHVLDAGSGAQLDRVLVDTGFELAGLAGQANGPAGLSPQGRRLVLIGGSRDGNGRLTVSAFRVYDTAALHAPPQAVSLAGQYTVQGIDDAGRTLWLLHWVLQPNGATVTTLQRYDLVHDTLDPNPVTSPSCRGAELTGGQTASVATPDGRWQLTVYAFGGDGPFVQALDLAGGTVTCIALTHAQAPPASPDYELDLLWTLARSHDGHHVYAVNAGTGHIVDIAASPPFHTRGATLPTPPPSPSPASWLTVGSSTAEAKRLLTGGAVLSPDDRVLYAAADEGVTVIDVATLAARRILVPDQAVQSLALSPDGRWLYAVADARTGGLYQVDTTTGASIAIPLYSDSDAVLRVSAAP